ncbi:MAG: Helix-turn-helix domain [Chthoniobacter sp.]|jgi:hypothetical protein|nr:Helix-turn-helix domain [Chthoniobacter sp.]
MEQVTDERGYKAADNVIPRKIAYSRAEAAALLSISLTTLDDLVKRGLIRPSRATRWPLFAHAELERFMAETTAHLA